MPVSADALRSHLEYNAWATLRLLDAAAELTPDELAHDFLTADRTVAGTLGHLFASERIWFARLTGGEAPTYISAADRELATLRTEWPALFERWKTWAAGITDEHALEVIAYRDLRARHWKQPLWQLIMHVVNHGTHHRGQVAGFLRSLGRVPPPLDLVAYYRQQQV
jgi:uncharacterized damage-inducible protein DinB